jgi:hypothetical protein
LLLLLLTLWLVLLLLRWLLMGDLSRHLLLHPLLHLLLMALLLLLMKLLVHLGLCLLRRGQPLQRVLHLLHWHLRLTLLCHLYFPFQVAVSLMITVRSQFDAES